MRTLFRTSRTRNAPPTAGQKASLPLWPDCPHNPPYLPESAPPAEPTPLCPDQLRRLLGEADAAPVILCIGTDRTGLITYLLLGYLGVDEQDIYRDYLFSNFANIGGSRDLGGITTKYVATIKNKYGGKSTPLSKKCRAALLDIGVEPAELEAISEIFTA